MDMETSVPQLRKSTEVLINMVCRVSTWLAWNCYFWWVIMACICVQCDDQETCFFLLDWM